MPTFSEKEGNVMDAPANSIILHACNAKGKWGDGVAKKLRRKFGQAFEDYADKCRSAAALDSDPDALQRNLVGTCIVKAMKDPVYPPGSRIYVASLITSLNYGKEVDEPAQILENTRKAFRSLKNQIFEINIDNAANGIDPIDEIRAVRLNSGRFKVPWEHTRAVLEEEYLEEDERRLEVNLRVVYPPKPKPRARIKWESEDAPVPQYSTFTSPAKLNPASTSPVESNSIPPSPATAYAESVEVPLPRASKKRKAVDELHDLYAAEERSAPHALKSRDRQGSPSKLQVERALTQDESDVE